MDGLAAEATIEVDGKEHRYVEGWKQTVFEFSVFAIVVAFFVAGALLGDTDGDSTDVVGPMFLIVMLAVSVPNLIKNFRLVTNEAWPAARDDLRKHWRLTALMSVSLGVSLGWLLATAFWGTFDAGSIGLVVAAAASTVTLFQVRPRMASDALAV